MIKVYKKCWKYLKESRNYLYLIFGLFILFVLIGFFFPVFFSDEIMAFIEQTLGQTQNLGFWQLFIFIFKNNLIISILGLALGSILGILPLILTVSNGYVLGYVANKTALVSPLSLFRIFPHGIFEIPAVIISLALGLKLGLSIFRKKANFKYEFSNSLKVFLYIAIPLLLVAALIEAALIIFIK